MHILQIINTLSLSYMLNDTEIICQDSVKTRVIIVTSFSLTLKSQLYFHCVLELNCSHFITSYNTGYRATIVVWCGVVWCGVVWCGVVWCGVVGGGGGGVQLKKIRTQP